MIMRRLARSATLLTLFAVLSGCKDEPTPPDQATIDALTVTPQPGTPSQEAAKGTTALGLASPRDGWLYVPQLYDHATQTPLVVLLHGQGGDADDFESYKALADTYGCVILAIDSRYTTWDAIETAFFGVDVDFLEQALEFTFDRVNVDPDRISLAGFSDGASEAIGIGIANAGLFKKILAFSPGHLLTVFSRGFPRIMVSAGNDDDIVSFSTTRDYVVAGLRNQGFTVEFVSFAGGHEVPTDVRNHAFDIATQEP
jgi:predicted esterase